MIDPTRASRMVSEIADIGRKLKAQDNRCTAHPIFMVQSKGNFGQWQNVQPFFTEEAADSYIALNGHNLKTPRTYVESGYRNAEWIALRALFIEAADAEDEVAR